MGAVGARSAQQGNHRIKLQKDRVKWTGQEEKGRRHLRSITVRKLLEVKELHREPLQNKRLGWRSRWGAQSQQVMLWRAVGEDVLWDVGSCMFPDEDPFREALLSMEQPWTDTEGKDR